MTEPKSTNEPFSEDDLFFTCPHCGKNMAIEKRGMGLTIQCPDCRGLVKVPKLSAEELLDKSDSHIPAESDLPDLSSSLTLLEKIYLGIEGIQNKYNEIEQQFNRQQDAVQSLQEEVQHLQNAMDTLSKQMKDSVT